MHACMHYNHALFNRVRRISYTTYQSVLKKRKDRFCCKGYYGIPNYCKGTVNQKTFRQSNYVATACRLKILLVS